jgi:DNA polymerase-1
MEWARAAEYATVDAVVTLHAAEHQLARFGQGEGSRASMDRLLAQGRELLRIERRGVGYDRQRSLEIAEQMKKVESSMRVGLPFRATPAGAKRYFFTERGYDPAERTATGQPRLDDQEVSRLVALGAPFAREYQELRSIEVARTKWYESYAEHCGWDGRLRTKFSQAKVISGRLSSTRVNLQAIPHDYQLKEITERGWETPRQLFRARDGARLWELDLSQAELRVAAVEAGCTSMLELIREGADIHGSVTSDLFNIQPEHPDWGEKRQIGKRADFAFIFGVGADTFQFDLAKLTGIWLPIGECQSIVAKWRKLFPEYGRAIKRYMDLADRRQWIRLVNGRVRHFASWEDQHKAFNQYVQGSLAELMTDWLIEVGKRWPGLVLLTIHDSLVLETADEALVQEVRQLGEELGTKMFKVPMVVDMKVWGE